MIEARWIRSSSSTHDRKPGSFFRHLQVSASFLPRLECNLALPETWDRPPTGRVSGSLDCSWSRSCLLINEEATADRAVPEGPSDRVIKVPEEWSRLPPAYRSPGIRDTISRGRQQWMWIEELRRHHMQIERITH